MVDGNVAPYGAMVLTVALVAIVGVLLVRWFRARPRVRSALADVQFHASALAALAEGAGQTVLVLDSAGAIKGVVGADGARQLGLELRPGHLLLEAAPEDLAEPLRCLFELARRSPGERVTQRAVRAFGTASAPELEISAVDGRRLPSFGGIVVSFRVALDGPDAATSARSPRGLDAIFQQTATPIFLVDDASGRVVDLNPAAEQTYAWPREELIERSFDLISAPEGRQEGSRPGCPLLRRAMGCAMRCIGGVMAVAFLSVRILLPLRVQVGHAGSFWSTTSTHLFALNTCCRVSSRLPNRYFRAAISRAGWIRWCIGFSTGNPVRRALLDSGWGLKTRFSRSAGSPAEQRTRSAP